MSKTKTFAFEGKSSDMLGELKEMYKTKSKKKALERALALAICVNKLADEEGRVAIVSGSNFEYAVKWLR